MVNWDKWFKPTITIAAIIYILSVLIPLIVGACVIIGMVVSGDIVITNGNEDLTSIATTNAEEYTTMIYAHNTTYFQNGTIAYNGIYVWDGDNWILQLDDKIIKSFEEILTVTWNT